MSTPLPADLAGSTGTPPEVLELSAASIPSLAGYAARTFASVTIVAHGWTEIFLAEMPARLMVQTRKLVVRVADETPRSLRPAALGALTLRGADIRWSGTNSAGVEVMVEAAKPAPVVTLLRGALGRQVGLPRVPLRAGISNRQVEPYLVGNPYIRYSEVDDVIVSLHQRLAAVDVVLDATEAVADCGPVAGTDETRLPVVRVLASPAPSGAATDFRGRDRALLVPPVDTKVVNPVGFDAGPHGRHGRLFVDESDSRFVCDDDRGRNLFAIQAGAPLNRRHIQLTRRLRYLAVDPSAFHRPIEAARLLSQLAAAGVPLVTGPLPESQRVLLGEAVADILERITPELLAEPFVREAASVRLRRQALRTFNADVTARAIAALAGVSIPPRPTVSVLLVTRRPEFLKGALDQIEQQTWAELEVVLGLHGDHFPPREVEEATAGYSRPLTIVAIPAAVPFGEAFNRVTSVARGTYVAKWDDDDLYGAEHVWDLVAATDYSGADVVGKGSDIVVMQERGTTLRAESRGTERRVRNVAGGTFLLRRETLDDVGGWRPLAFSIDRALLVQLGDAGATIYRTHQFGYLLRRHALGHTWDPGDRYFLDKAQEQWDVTSARQTLALNAEWD